MRDGYYRTGDVAARDADGYFTYVGRADDVFKASDYRISPFELESVLIEHGRWPRRRSCRARIRCAWPCPRPSWCSRAGYAPSRELAAVDPRASRATAWRPTSASAGSSSRELPKTISGKIRRVELRKPEAARAGDARRAEFWEEDFPELR